MDYNELGHAKVRYFDRITLKEDEVDMYFRYLPNRGDEITVYTRDKREVKGRVRTVSHYAEDQRRIEPDITIMLEGL